MFVLNLRKIAHLIVPVIILTVTCFIANSNLNQHYHKLSSGFVVKHAHPYQKENSDIPFQSHAHSSFEFFLLDQISISLFVSFSIILSCMLFHRLIKRINSPITVIHKQTDLYFLKNYHAPPSILF